VAATCTDNGLHRDNSGYFGNIFVIVIVLPCHQNHLIDYTQLAEAPVRMQGMCRLIHESAAMGRIRASFLSFYR
jgi:hypothetical protein